MHWRGNVLANRALPTSALVVLLFGLGTGAVVTGCESVTYGSDDSPVFGTANDASNTGSSDSSGSSGSSNSPNSSNPLTPASGTTTTTEAESSRQIYEVQRGETLISIAAKFGVGLNELVSTNNIADPRLIYVGQKLIIPPPSDEADRPALTIAPPTNPSLPPVFPTLPPTSTTLWE